MANDVNITEREEAVEAARTPASLESEAIRLAAQLDTSMEMQHGLQVAFNDNDVDSLSTQELLDFDQMMREIMALDIEDSEKGRLLGMLSQANRGNFASIKAELSREISNARAAGAEKQDITSEIIQGHGVSAAEQQRLHTLSIGFDLEDRESVKKFAQAFIGDYGDETVNDLMANQMADYLQNDPQGRAIAKAYNELSPEERLNQEARDQEAKDRLTQIAADETLPQHLRRKAQSAIDLKLYSASEIQGVLDDYAQTQDKGALSREFGNAMGPAERRWDDQYERSCRKPSVHPNIPSVGPEGMPAAPQARAQISEIRADRARMGKVFQNIGAISQGQKRWEELTAAEQSDIRVFTVAEKTSHELSMMNRTVNGKLAMTINRMNNVVQEANPAAVEALRHDLDVLDDPNANAQDRRTAMLKHMGGDALLEVFKDDPEAMKGIQDTLDAAMAAQQRRGGYKTALIEKAMKDNGHEVSLSRSSPAQKVVTMGIILKEGARAMGGEQRNLATAELWADITTDALKRNGWSKETADLANSALKSGARTGISASDSFDAARRGDFKTAVVEADRAIDSAKVGIKQAGASSANWVVEKAEKVTDAAMTRVNEAQRNVGNALSKAQQDFAYDNQIRSLTDDMERAGWGKGGSKGMGTLFDRGAGLARKGDGQLSLDEIKNTLKAAGISLAQVDGMGHGGKKDGKIDMQDLEAAARKAKSTIQQREYSQAATALDKAGYDDYKVNGKSLFNENGGAMTMQDIVKGLEKAGVKFNMALDTDKDGIIERNEIEAAMRRAVAAKQATKGR
jgi:hypothetical protein